jgi:hypothetical protein
MSEAPESQGAPSTEAAFRPKRGRAVIGVAAVGVAIAAGVGVLAWRSEVESREREATAWGNLSRCLVGEPLAAGEKPSLRARKIQLRAVAEPWENRPASDGDPWPARCSAPALALHETLKGTGRLEKDGASLGKAAEAFGKKLKENLKPSVDIVEALDRIFAEAETIKLVGKPAADAKAPPAPIEAMTLDALEAATPLVKRSFPLDTVFSERVPAGTLRLIATSKDLPGGPLVCSFPEGAPSGRCDAPPPSVLAISKDLRLLGSAEDDAPTLLFADKRGDGGIFRADSGEKVGAVFSYGGFSRKDGFVTALGWDDNADKKKPFLLYRQTKGGAPKEDRFKLEGVTWALNDAALLWDHMVWERWDGKKGERRLFAKKLDESGDPAADPTDVGKLWDYERISDYGKAEDTIRGCKTKEALVVLVHGYARDSVAFRLADRWVEPLQLAGRGGALTCRGTEATETRIDPLRGEASWPEQIRQDRCTPAGCQQKTVGVAELMKKLGELRPGDQRNIGAVDLDGKLLVVWIAGSHGGVRMKLAPIDQIAAAPDTVLIDDMTRGGQVGHARQLNDIRLFARAGYAVLLVGTPAGVFARSIDPNGKVSPIPVK